MERKSHVQDKENDLITAYHEAGHALVAYFTDAAEPVHKVTILQRDKALGFVRTCACECSITPQETVDVKSLTLGENVAASDVGFIL